MLTAGTSPAAAVRTTCASNASQSKAPSPCIGSSTADMPVMSRGRMRSTGSIRSGSVALARDRHPVADREHHGLDPGIVGDVVVERLQRNGVVVGGFGIEHGAVPQDVVGEQQPAGSEPRDELLEVGDVVALVGIDEGQV